MKYEQTGLKDCILIKPKIFEDKRGFFLESFHTIRYAKFIGPTLKFVQDNHSNSTKGVLRGLHFQRSKPQGKLVRVVRGAVFDVAVDLRKSSPTFGNWAGFELSEENKDQLWIPPGFAHGFLTLTDLADFEYKCTDYYDSSDEGIIKWDDSDLNISWPEIKPILSDKDKNAPSFRELFLCGF